MCCDPRRPRTQLVGAVRRSGACKSRQDGGHGRRAGPFSNGIRRAALSRAWMKNYASLPAKCVPPLRAIEWPWDLSRPACRHGTVAVKLGKNN